RNAEFLGQAQRHAELNGAQPISVGAKRVVGDDVAGADAAGLETVEIVAADEIPVLDPHVIAAEAENVAGLAGRLRHPVGRDRIVIAGAHAVAQEVDLAAEAGDIRGLLQVIARGRAQPAIALVIEQLLADDRGDARALLSENELRGAGDDVLDGVVADRVGQRLTQRFGELITRAQRAAIGLLLITRKRRVVALQGEEVEARGEVAIEEVRLGEAEIDLLRQISDRRVDAQILAASQQVALVDADIGERTIRGRIADADLEFAGRLLLDIDMDDRLVRRAALGVGDIDLFEEAEIVEPLLRAMQLGRIEGVALDQTELAPDHLVLGADVPGDVDALDIDLGTFLHREADIDRLGVDIAPDIGRDLDEGIAAVAERVGDRLDRLVDLIGVVPVAFLESEERAQQRRVHILQLIGDR